MEKLSLMLSSVVFVELVDKLENYWALFVFILNLILVLTNLIYDIIKKFKNKEDAPLYLENQAYLAKFSEDLKNYYESRKEKN